MTAVSGLGLLSVSTRTGAVGLGIAGGGIQGCLNRIYHLGEGLGLRVDVGLGLWEGWGLGLGLGL